MATLDLIVFLAYVAAVVAFGAYFVRKNKTTKQFMTAGGALPGWAVGLSIFGTYLSSNTFLGVPGTVYGGNFNAFVFSLSLPISAWLAVKYFVPFYRRGGEISAYHHLEKRFGAWARTYAAICYLLTQIARMGAIMFGVAIGLHALTGWDVASIIVVTGVLVTFYTLLGGIEAVIWTDVVQSVILMAGALLILVLLVFGMPGGASQSISIAHAWDKFSLGSWSVDFTTSTVWVVLLYGIFINLTNFGIDQSFVQRYHAADSGKAAARAVYIGALLYVPVSFVFFLIGAALFSYYEAHPGMLLDVKAQVAAQGGDASLNDQVLPHFIANKLSFGTAGLLIAALSAAAMSSIDTSLNSSATVILKDLWQRYVNPGISERNAMNVLRVATVITGLIGTGVAVAMIGVDSLLQGWWTLQGIFAGGMLGLFLLGIAARRTQGAHALLATALGLLVIAWMTLSATEKLPEALRSPLHTNMIIVAGTLTIFLAGTGLSFIFGNRERP